MKFFFITFIILLSGCSSQIFKPDVNAKLYSQKVTFYTDSELIKNQFKNNTINKDYKIQKNFLINKNINYLNNQLLWITKNKTLDDASLFLINSIYSNKNNNKINDDYIKNLSTINTNQFNLTNYSNYYFIFIPGWLYKSLPETGAGFIKIRQKLTDAGLANELLNTKENTSIKNNAKIISKRIAELPNKKIILVTVSKSGSEVASLINNQFLAKNTNLKGWVNISGLLKGSKLASYANQFPTNLSTELLFFINNLDTSTIQELEHKKQPSYFKNYTVNKNFTILNVVAVPFYNQVTFSGWFGYQLLYDFGPNDGRSLILDQLAPGKTLIEIGLDHYYQDKNMENKALAIMKTLIDDIESD